MSDEAAETPRKSGIRKRKGSSEFPRPTLAFRVNAALYKQIQNSAEAHGLSITEEIESRLKDSFYDAPMRGQSAQMMVAMGKVTERILRASRSYDEISEGTPLEDEQKTRRELRSALDFVTRVFTTTGEPLPEKFSVDGRSPRDWGSGDIGRLHAEVFLDEWSDDPARLHHAREQEVDFYWTPGPPRRSLEGIMAEKDGGRDRNVSAQPRPSDSGPDEGDETDTDAPAEQPKRTRRTKPKA